MRRAGILPLLIVAALCAVVVGACGTGNKEPTATEPPPNELSEEVPGEYGPQATAPESGEPPGAATKNCGADDLKATGVGCREAKAVLAAWRAAPGCAVAGGASHASCRIKGYLCIGAAVGKGTAVSCALPGRSIVFLEPR